MPRRFGLEIEVAEFRDLRDVGAIVESATEPFGDYPVQQMDYGHSTGECWTVKRDDSCGLEITTPALTLDEWPQVQAVLTALYAAGARTSRACGLHVHHEAPLDNVGVRKLWYLWYLFEPAIFAMLAPSRQSNRYCHMLRDWEGEQYYDRDGGSQMGGGSMTAFDPEMVLRMDADNFQSLVTDFDRYQALNLTDWWQTGRVEIRAHHGTLNSTDIKFWVMLTQRLVACAAEVTIAQLQTYELEGDDMRTQLRKCADLLNPAWYDTMVALVERRNPAMTAA